MSMSQPSQFCALVQVWAQILNVQIPCLPGLQALEARNRARIRCRNSRALDGSINLDASLQIAWPHAARWDYGIGLAEDDLSVIWVEVHPAETSEVSAILQKLAWLQQVLSQAPEMLREKSGRFCWVASGRINIPKHTHQYRRLRQTRIEGPLKTLEI